LSRDASTNDSVKRFRRIYEAKERGDTNYLIETLRDPDHRIMVAKYLGELGAVEATQPLLRLLDAADPDVRVAAAKALGGLGAREALPQLREITLHDQDDGVRSWAIGALGDIGDPGGVDLLVPVLRDSSWRVRAAAALALGRLGDPKALEPLRATRRELRRSPVEWYLYRRVYNRAIKILRTMEPTSGGSP
jgi:HEAT repeat protein